MRLTAPRSGTDFTQTALLTMQTTVEQLSPVLVQFNVQIDAERVTSEYEKAFRNVAKAARIKGFRPGKAPREIVQRVYGSRVEADVMQRLVEETFPKATEAQQVQTVNQPTVEPDRLRSGQPFSYKARVEVLPKIESVVYEGLVAKRPKAEPSEEQIEKELGNLQRANSTLQVPPQPRPAAEKDVLTCDIEVSADGAVVPGAGTMGLAIEIGAGQVFPEIERAVTGASLGAKVSAEVDMPASHPNQALAGKKATFTIEVKEIKERILPVLDDEFAKDLGDFSTLADLREDVKKQLTAQLKDQSDNVLAERLVQALVEANPVPVPPSLVEQQARLSEREILYRAMMQGTQARGLGEELRRKVMEESETKVRAGLVMAEIAKKEEIKIGNEQIEEGLKELAAQTGKNVAKVRAEYSEPRKREMLVGMILENKVLDLIESKANISDE
jgi:trigger factor